MGLASHSPAASRRAVPWILAALAAFLVLALAQSSRAAGPSLDARAWALIDARDGELLAAKGGRRELPIASATKLMTAYVALQRLELDEELVAPAYDPLAVESVLGLERGERIEVRDLITAMMLPSANDAAVTIAEGAARSRARFVELMNRAARRLGLESTSFANPIGLDDPDNFSSARDLVALARELMENRFFRRTVARTEAVLRTGATDRRVETRNSLARSDPRVEGIKTGRTRGAGYVLVSFAEARGIELIGAVLGAPSEAARDAETSKLLDHGFSLYERRRPIEPRAEVAAIPVEGSDRPLRVVAQGGVSVRARPDQELETRFELPDAIDGAVARGERLGRARVTLDGEPAGGVPLLATRAVAEPEAGVATLIGRSLGIALALGGAIVVCVAIVLFLRRRDGRSAEVSVRERTDQQRLSERRRRERRRNGAAGAADPAGGSGPAGDAGEAGGP